MGRNSKFIGLFAVTILFLILAAGTAVAAFEGGDGTAGNPYQIKTADQLNDVRNNLSAHYVLISDIDLAGTSYANNWVPIGSTSAPFKGTFNGKKADGENFEIQNLKMEYIDSGAIWNAGLFGVVDSAKIQDVNMTNVDILVSHSTNSNIENVGGMVGSANNSVIKGCHVTGNITGVKNAGGVVGKILDLSVVENCSFSGNVYSTQGWSGGITGFANGDIINCQVTESTVESKIDKAGGITGQLSGNITGCYVTGSTKVIGSTSTYIYIGGLVGFLNGPSEIKNSNSAASVEGKGTGTMGTGGLVGGTAGNNIKISNCSSTGTVKGKNAVGGLVGIDLWESVIENCYSSAVVSSNGTGAGGIIGYSINGKILNSFSTGKVTASKNGGGVIGQAKNVSIDYCYVTGNVSTTNSSGGIIGYDEGTSKLSNCYALSENVSGVFHVNRMIGRAASTVDISNSYAWENMTGKNNTSQPEMYGSNLTSSEIWNTFPAGKWTGWSSSIWSSNDYIKFRLPVPSWTDKNIQADASHLMPPITLTYDGNGFTTEADTVPVDSKVYLKPSDSGYPENATVKESGDMKKDGFEFEKWTTKPDGSGDSYNPDDEIEMKESVTLYAQWTEKEEEKNTGGSSGNGTGNATVSNPKPIQPEGNMSGFENETMIEEPEKIPEIIKPFLILLFFLLAIAIYLFIKRRRDEEEDKRRT